MATPTPAGQVLEQQLSYWKKQLAEAPPVLDLPMDRIRPAEQNFTSAAHELHLSERLSTALFRLARAEGATPFMVLLAMFQAILGRWSGQDDVVVGTPIAGRSHRLTEGLIGFFVNMLTLRTNLGGDPSFRELLQRVKKVAVEAYAHQDVPFERVIEAISPDRSLSHTPIFQVVLNMLEADEQVEAGTVRMQIVSQATLSSKFDFTLYVQERADVGVQARLQCNSVSAEPNVGFSGSTRQHAGASRQEPDEKLSKLSLVTRNARQIVPIPDTGLVASGTAPFTRCVPNRRPANPRARQFSIGRGVGATVSSMTSATGSPTTCAQTALGVAIQSPFWVIGVRH